MHPEQSRNQLIFTGNGEKGAHIPLVEWGREFANILPEPIRDAIRKARSGATGSIDDEDYRKRLQDRFGKRWTMKMLVETISKGIKGFSMTSEQVDSMFQRNEAKENAPKGTTPRGHKKSIPTSGGSKIVHEQEMPVDVPKYKLSGADKFEQPWHLALWAPTDPEGPTVYINTESPILQESVDYHLQQYPDVYATEVAETVRRVFGELATCKIAHSQMLKKHIPEQEIDNDYRSEKALTISLMGLLAEESVIAQRLKKLGQKKDILVGTPDVVKV